MLKSWSNLREFDLPRMKPEDCERWAAKYAEKANATNFNNCFSLDQIM
jgi:hypothetical protein